MEVANLLTRAESAARDFRQAEAQFGDVANHEYIGRILLMKAKMQRGLVETVATHHTGGKSPMALVGLIHLADNICKDLGLGYFPQVRGVYSEAILRTLKLTEKDIRQLQTSLGESLHAEIEDLVDRCISA